LTTLLGIGAMLTFGFGPGLAQVASAQCADPRGNAYCANGGQVTFASPTPKPTAGTAAVTNPTGGNVNVTNPTGGNVNVTNPTGGNVNVTNPTGGNVDVTNPNAGQTDAPNPNIPVGIPVDLSVVVAPASAAAGDTIAVAGKGFTANGRGNLIFINVVGADGVPFDTRYTAITCVETDNVYLAMLQDLGWGCTLGASGPLTRSADDGTFRASITVPPVAAGDGKVCISSVFSNPVCTPLTVEDGGG
jgi:hypothetical protein